MQWRVQGTASKTLRIDFFAAMDAFSETAFSNAGQSFLHHLQKLALVIALAKEKLFGVGTGGAIGNVLGRIFVGGATVGLSAGNSAAQVLLALCHG